VAKTTKSESHPDSNGGLDKAAIVFCGVALYLLVRRHEPKKTFARRLHRLTPIKTNHCSDPVIHLLGDSVSVDNRMNICVNLCNLRAELRFLG
jgi:hypothetical protein